MIGIDTNVLVRYLTQDDQAQWEKATQVIEGETQCLISNVVLCELVWVLRSKPYQFDRATISQTLELILQCSSFELEDRSLVYQALQRFKQGKADFSDYLIGAIAHQYDCSTTVTFDQKLKNEPGFELLLIEGL